MSFHFKSEQNVELLLENLIRVQAKLIEKVDHLTRRLNHIEQNYPQTTHQDIIIYPAVPLHQESTEVKNTKAESHCL